MDIRAQIGSRERVLAAFTDADLPHHFAAAVEWMREAGPLDKKGAAHRTPVLISAGEKPRLLCA
jgi:hypothetical protein